METFEQYGIHIPYGRRGRIKLPCPKCKDSRSHPNDKSLSVDIDKGVWKCHHCEWTGGLKNKSPFRIMEKPKKEYKRPVSRPIVDLSLKLLSWFKDRKISEATLKAMRVNEGMRYFPQDDAHRNAVHFYYYRKGELVNIKYRDGKKNFTLESGAELIPYNIDAIAEVDNCIITEGEIDCLSFVEIGYKNCVSLPNGANSLAFLDDCIEEFDHIDTIYIAVDTDSAGIKARDELIRRFGAGRCKLVTYGDGCKDANEHLVKYGPDSLRQCIESARECIGGVFTVRDYEDELDLIYSEGLKKGYIIGHQNFDDICSFETKRLAIVTGIPGSGKSEFIDELCWRLNNIYGFKVGYFSPENMPLGYHAVKLIEKLCGRICVANKGGQVISREEYMMAKDYLAENFFHILPEDVYSIDNILDRAKYLVKKRGIKILVIDPFNRIESEQQRNESETQYISRVLNSLSNFAQQNDLLVFLMAHPRKISKTENNGIPTAYDINGSANFYNMADFIIIVHRLKEENKVLVKIEKIKFRHLGECGEAYFRYNRTNGRYIPTTKDAGKEFTESCDNKNYIGCRLLPVAAARGSGADYVATSEAPSNNEMPFEQPSDETELPF